MSKNGVFEEILEILHKVYEEGVKPLLITVRSDVMVRLNAELKPAACFTSSGVVTYFEKLMDISLLVDMEAQKRIVIFGNSKGVLRRYEA